MRLVKIRANKTNLDIRTREKLTEVVDKWMLLSNSDHVCGRIDITAPVAKALGSLGSFPFRSIKDLVGILQ